MRIGTRSDSRFAVVGVRKRTPAASSRTVATAGALFAIGVCTVEWQRFNLPIQPWNLTMVCAGLLAACIALVAIFAGRERLPQPRLFVVDAVFLTYLTWCALSSTWSVSPADTLVQTAYALVAWFATLFVRILEPDFFVRILIRFAVFTAIASFTLIAISPTLAFQSSWSVIPELKGIFFHQQRLGLFMGVCLGLLVIARLNGVYADIVGSRIWRWLTPTLLLACFIAAFARLNSVYVLVALVATILLFRNVTSRVLTVLGLIALTALILVNSGEIFANFGVEGGETLTGRTNVWNRTLTAASDVGAFGFGFATFDSSVFDAFWGDYRAPSAHNSLLQAYFETGYFGAALVCVFAVVQLATAYRAGTLLRRLPYSFFVTLVAVLSSLTGVTYAGKPTVVMILAILLVVSERQESAQIDLGHLPTFPARAGTA